MISDFLLKLLIWALFYETLEIILTICCSSLPLTPFCRRKGILPFWWQMKVEVYVFTRKESFHVISGLVWKFKFQQGLHWYYPSWGRGKLYLVTAPHMASTDTIMGGVVSLLMSGNGTCDSPLSLFLQGVSLLPGGDEHPGSSTQLFKIPPHPAPRPYPRQRRRFGALCSLLKVEV